MKEIIFLKKNKNKWQEDEEKLKKANNLDPDELCNLYIDLSDDLAYSKTYYPESKTTTYLNQTATKLHAIIYKNKKENWSKIISFWTEDLPKELLSIKKYLLASFIIFALSIFVGALSSAYDDSFVRYVLGDGYVNMTERNIEEGKPMNVYASSSEDIMFFSITFNNLMVSFYTFVFGIFWGLGTLYILFKNGLMIGAFHMMLVHYGVFWESVSTIWLHGTIEISSIIISGATGLMIGNSLISPGSYSRLNSLQKAAKKAVKIAIGLFPFIVLAGFVESFITRYHFMPLILKLAIISISAFIIVYYFFIYPLKFREEK